MCFGEAMTWDVGMLTARSVFTRLTQVFICNDKHQWQTRCIKLEGVKINLNSCYEQLDPIWSLVETRIGVTVSVRGIDQWDCSSLSALALSASGSTGSTDTDKTSVTVGEWRHHWCHLGWHSLSATGITCIVPVVCTGFSTSLAAARPGGLN
jgi:hypothetical protein